LQCTSHNAHREDEALLAEPILTQLCIEGASYATSDKQPFDCRESIGAQKSANMAVIDA